MTVNLDVQEIGWRDTVSENGVLDVYVKRQGLAKIPFRTGHFIANGTGSTTTVNPDALWENGDSTSAGLNINVGGTQPNPPTRGIRIQHTFWGTTYGLRFQQNYNTPLNYPFSCMIDGTAYVIANSDLWADNGPTLPAVNQETAVIIATDLPDTEHYADLIFPANTTANALWLIWGYLADRGAGYRDPTMLQDWLTPAAMPTSNTAVPTSVGGSLQRSLRAYRQIVYCNTDAANPHTVKVYWGNGTTLIWSKIIAASDTQVFDMGALTTLAAGPLYHSCDSATVNYTVIGGFV